VVSGASALIVRDKVSKDQRHLIKVYDRFGFNGKAGVSITVNDDQVHFHENTGAAGVAYARKKMGFVIGFDDNESDLEASFRGEECPLDTTWADPAQTKWIKVMDFSQFGDHPEAGFENDMTNIEASGWLSVWFINCAPGTMVSFDVSVALFTPTATGRNYLNIGEVPLITVYGFLAFAYSGLLVLWLVIVYRNKSDAHRIHALMAVLVLFKFLTMMAMSGKYRVNMKNGDATGWEIAWYIFNTIRGLLFFLVIVLVAVGWSYMKPFLSDRDKKVLLVVLPLQCFITIATIVTQEEGPAAPNFTSWDTLLLVAQFVCFCAILFPIVWSMKHLREASRTDGKAARNYMKMQMFRQFYVWVVAFVYFKLIIFYLLKSTLDPSNIWIAETSMETVTFAFYIFVGLRFQPKKQNPFLSLEMADFEPPADSDDEEAHMLGAAGQGSSSQGPGKGD